MSYIGAILAISEREIHIQTGFRIANGDQSAGFSTDGKAPGVTAWKRLGDGTVTGVSTLGFGHQEAGPQPFPDGVVIDTQLGEMLGGHL